MTTPIVVTSILVGIVAGLAIAFGVAPAFGFPHMEGSSAIFGVLVGAPLGAVAGGLCGRALSHKYAGDPQKQKLILTGAWVVIGIIVLQGVVSSWIGGNDYLGQSESSIAYQIRLPAGAAMPAKESDVLVELRSDKETRKAEYAGKRLLKDGDRTIVQGYIEFRRVTPDRTIALRVGDGPTHLFKLTIPARPKSSPGSYEQWFAVSQIDDNKAGQPLRPPRPEEVSEIRHFVTIRD